jgi:hypothetical protein
LTLKTGTFYLAGNRNFLFGSDTFVLERIRDLSIEGFNSQNVLNGISLARGSDYYELVLEEIHGLAGKFQADEMRIELDPGIPSGSIYGR